MNDQQSFRRGARLGFFAAWTLIIIHGCAHEPISDPRGPGQVIVGVTLTGVIFNESGHDLWLAEKVPASYFTNVGPGRWYISSVDFHQGELTRLNGANP